MLNLPKTREQARLEGSKAYFTGLFCKQGHISKRWTATGNCAECQKKRTLAWADKNKDKIKAYLYSDEMKKKRQEYGKVFYLKNREIFIAKDAKRRALKLQATTLWGQDGIKAFYKKAKELQEMNPGTKYHVDHIVPLVGEDVCGLHNQFNLQILTASENWRKGNKHGT